MKKILLVFMCAAFSTLNSFSQDSEDSFPNYQRVFEMEGKTKSEIYPLLKTWIAINFVSANDITQLDDPENGKIIVKYIYITHQKQMGMSYQAKTYNTATFDIKDNKFRCSISVTNVTTGTSEVPVYDAILKNKKGYKGIKVSIEKKIDEIFESLTKLNTISETNNDW